MSSIMRTSRRAVCVASGFSRLFSLNVPRRGMSIAAIPEPVIGEISYLDIRVGKVVSVSEHPSDPSLYIKKIQIAENGTEERTIIAGIRNFCTKDELLDSSVIVLCNLKPRVIRGVDSTGMVLCCSDASKTKVKPVRPPQGCPPGTIVTFPGFKSLVGPVASAEDLPSVSFNRINKAFSKVAPGLLVNEQGVAVLKVSTATPAGKKQPKSHTDQQETRPASEQFKIVEFLTPEGPCTGPILNSTIS